MALLINFLPSFPPHLCLSLNGRARLNSYLTTPSLLFHVYVYITGPVASLPIQHNLFKSCLSFKIGMFLKLEKKKKEKYDTLSCNTGFFSMPFQALTLFCFSSRKLKTKICPV